MSITINNTPNFAPTNNGNGTHLEVAVKAKQLSEEEGKMALKLIDSAGSTVSSNNPIGNIGSKVNIKV